MSKLTDRGGFFEWMGWGYALKSLALGLAAAALLIMAGQAGQ